jgi:hypothetical protein
MRADRIADAVEQRMRQEHDGLITLYRRELAICVGAGRVDVAAVNGALTGCEVKSASDGLGRLPSQIELYGQVVDYAILAVERVYPRRVVSLLPQWWGVWHAVDDGNSVRLDVVRSPKRNPNVSPLAVAQLLWRDEALGVLRSRGLHRGLSAATRWRLWQHLANSLTLDDLRCEVREHLKARQDW